METRKLRFVTLVGSTRRQSAHRMIANTLPDLAPGGACIDHLASVAGFPIYDADTQAVGFPNIVEITGAAIAESDGVIIVSPEYNYSVPGPLKNAIDWVSRLPSAPFAGKPVAIQSASPGMLGGARMQYHLRQIMVYLDARVLNKPEVMISQVTTKIDGSTERLTDEATRAFIQSQLNAFAAFVQPTHCVGPR